MSELTPLMKQYFSIKESHPDAIVLFRLGDFYEMFGEDAETASKILQIALTTRDRTKEDPVPMCGIPYFASESYIAKLIKAGYKVAICEQMEDPKEAKGIVRREVVKVITPGTYSPENPKENVYIACIYPFNDKFGVALADISTGEFLVYETEENIEDEAHRFEPREVLLPRSFRENIHCRESLSSFYVSFFDDGYFDYSEAYRILLKHFRVSSLDGYGCEGMTAAVSAAGALVSYLAATQKENLSIRKITTLRQGSSMFLDAATQRNLELTHTLKDRLSEGTLLGVLDETLTPMGGRFLRNSLLKPLINKAEITRRQDAAGYLLEDYELREMLMTSLGKIQDMERLASRIDAGTANARDLIAMKQTISVLPKLRKALLASGDPYLHSLAEDLADFNAVADIIGKGIIDSPLSVSGTGALSGMDSDLKLTNSG